MAKDKQESTIRDRMESNGDAFIIREPKKPVKDKDKKD